MAAGFTTDEKDAKHSKVEVTLSFLQAMATALLKPKASDLAKIAHKVVKDLEAQNNTEGLARMIDAGQRELHNGTSSPLDAYIQSVVNG